MYIRLSDSAAPNGQSLASLNWLSITLAIIRTFLPPKRSGVRKEPSAGMKVMMMPDTMPTLASGTTMEKKVRVWLAPRSRLASR